MKSNKIKATFSRTTDSGKYGAARGDVADALSHDEHFQRQLFRFFTPISLTFLVVYAGLQARAGLSGLAFLYVVSALALAINWWALRFHHNAALAANLFILVGPIVLLPWQVTGGLSGSGLMWFPAYVVFTMFFVRGRWGTFWVVLIYTVSFFLLLLQLQGLFALPFPRALMFHFYFVGAVTYAVALLFRHSQNITFDLLRNQATSLREAEAIARMGSWSWDTKTDVIHWSPQVYRIFAVKPGTKMNYESYLERIYPEDRELVDRIVKQALKDHQPYTIRHRVQHAGGSILWVQSLGQIALDELGKPIAMLGTAQDVTDRVTSERQAAQRTEELEKLNNLMLGRELKMIELKEEIKKLKKRQSIGIENA